MKMKSVKQIEEPLSAVGFGCWATGGGSVWNDSRDEESIRTIRRALELGVNLFDVAPVYGFGHAERILGQALKGRRDEVLIASKFGIGFDHHGSTWFTASNVMLEIDSSLRRLQTDYIDIYQVHWPDPRTPIEDTVEALLKLKDAGKIRYIGLSNFSPFEAQRALDAGPVASYQGLYNMLERNPVQYHSIPLAYRTEHEILPLVQQNGLAFFPYSPLFQGLLTGTFTGSGDFDEKDVRSANPKLRGESLRQYLEVVEKLKAFANEIGHPLSQVAINWLIRQDAVTSVICGAQRVAHIEENVGSTDWELTDDMLVEIESILAPYRHLL